jgi:hypothetical protein
MKKSKLDEMKVLIKRKLSKEQQELFQTRIKKSQGNAEGNEYYRIFQYILDENVEKIKEYDSDNLRNHLRKLKEKIVEVLAVEKRKEHFSELLKIETLFELKLTVDGLEKTEKLLKELQPEDYWIRWRLIDLLYKNLSFDDIENRPELLFDELQFLAQKSIDSIAVNIDRDEFLDKSPLAEWMNLVKKEYEKKYGD